MSKCSAEETPVCCCMDVGTIMDNTDCTASYSRVFTARADAEATLAALTEKARSVESDPCQITSTFTEVADGVAEFLFERIENVLTQIDVFILLWCASVHPGGSFDRRGKYLFKSPYHVVDKTYLAHVLRLEMREIFGQVVCGHILEARDKHL